VEQKENIKTSTREILRKYGMRAKKKLGQHWLISDDIVHKIANACVGAGGILEIGSGFGILTRHLVHLAPTWAIELDERLKKPLTETAPNAQIIIGDVLDIDLHDLLLLIPRPKVIVSNLPFYITTPVLEGLLSVSDHFDWAVIMLQKEVGDKLLAETNDSKRSALSVLYQYRFKIEVVCKVSKRDFVPQPSVEAIVLKLRPIKNKKIPMHFEKAVRMGFRYPRKTLSKNFLMQDVGDKKSVERCLTKCGITLSARPHQLSVEDWVRLASRELFRKN